MSESLSQFRIERRYRARIYFFIGFIFVAGAILSLRLADLQIVNGYDNSIQAKKFVSRQEYTKAPRGLIFDRNYTSGAGGSRDTLLVKNITYIDFVIYPTRFKNRNAGVLYVKRFCKIMGRKCTEYRDRLGRRYWRRLSRRNKPLILMTRMTLREQERLWGFKIIAEKGEFVTRHLRYYAMGPALAHVTGYVGKPSHRDIALKKAKPYQIIGKSGIEAIYDRKLRGRDGIRVRHKILNAEEQIAISQRGANLVLTIDKKIQAAAYYALSKKKKRGAVVAIKVATGEILALASSFSYDPNILSSGTSSQRARHLIQMRRHKSFLNMAIQTKSPPGSTFKTLVALAALEYAGRNPVDEHLEFFCPGKWKLKSTLAGVPDTEFFCWKHSGHGKLDLIGAIAQSCSVYFYQLGYRIGSRRIIEYARAFGLDKKTGIDLPGEIAGFVPDHRWKQLRLSSRWYDGDTVNLSIGQGYLEVTPLANAVMFAALSNQGKIYRPVLLKEIRDPDTDRIIYSFRPELIREVPALPANLDIVQRGMRAVILPGGTTSFINRKDLAIAGKSGTAQSRSKRKGPDHAWFVAYAPYGGQLEDRVVVSVFLEYGGGGSANAAPIAAAVLNAAFPEGKYTPVIKSAKSIP